MLKHTIHAVSVGIAVLWLVVLGAAGHDLLWAVTLAMAAAGTGAACYLLSTPPLGGDATGGGSTTSRQCVEYNRAMLLSFGAFFFAALSLVFAWAPPADYGSSRSTAIYNESSSVAVDSTSEGGRRLFFDDAHWLSSVGRMVLLPLALCAELYMWQTRPHKRVADPTIVVRQGPDLQRAALIHTVAQMVSFFCVLAKVMALSVRSLGAASGADKLQLLHEHYLLSI